MTAGAADVTLSVNHTVFKLMVFSIVTNCRRAVGLGRWSCGCGVPRSLGVMCATQWSVSSG